MMMKQFPLNVRIAHPRPYLGERLNIVRTTTLKHLLEEVDLPLRVSGPSANPKVILFDAQDLNYRGKSVYYVGIGGISDSEITGFVLEVLAFGFHDYSARESIVGHVKFIPKVYTGVEK